MDSGSAPMKHGHRWYALGLLMVVGLFNYIDRLCMSILQVPIKQELGLTDTQLGIMTGLAFSLLYTTMAAPIARLADLTARKYVIAGALAVWSLMTAACGFARSFIPLATLRMGVAIGEAGCVPATHALLADYFPLRERGRAIATWALVFPLGTLVGIASGGWLSEAIGWRNAFLLLGSLGLCLVPVVLFTLREPPRGGHAAGPEAAYAPSFGEAVRTLSSSPAFRNSCLGGALIAYPLNAELLWNAPFYSRVFGLSLREMAVWLALLAGGAGAIGLYSSGLLADRMGRASPRWYMLVPAITGLAAPPFMLLQYFVHDVRWSLAFGAVSVVLLNAFVPPQIAATQSLVEPNLRALASATNVLAAGTLGAALGPFATGVLSDLLAVRWALEQDSLRYAIGVSSALALAGGYFFLRAARTFPQELLRNAEAKSTAVVAVEFTTSGRAQ